MFVFYVSNNFSTLSEARLKNPFLYCFNYTLVYTTCSKVFLFHSIYNIFFIVLHNITANSTNLWNILGYDPNATEGNLETVSLRIVAMETSSAVTYNVPLLNPAPGL